MYPLCFFSLFLIIHSIQEDNVFAKPETVPVKSVSQMVSMAPAPMDISEDKPEAFSKALMNIEDIDANDKENPQLVSDYVNDIYEYMKILEVCFC